MALAILFASVLGPIADHHFAERQPWHTHLSQVKPGHQHQYQLPHLPTPDHPLSQTSAPVAFDFDSAQGSLFLSFSNLALSAEALIPPSPAFLFSTLWFSLQPLPEIFLPPPDKPPTL